MVATAFAPDAFTGENLLGVAPRPGLGLAPVRSDSPPAAIQPQCTPNFAEGVQLEHAREKGGLAAMVLADANGLMVASSGDADLCEELAAMAPLMATAPLGMPLSPLLKGCDVSVRPVSVDHQRLFLAAVIATSAAGLRRILASN